MRKTELAEKLVTGLRRNFPNEQNKVKFQRLANLNDLALPSMQRKALWE